MAMNNMGAGFILKGEDKASPVIQGFMGTLRKLRGSLGGIGVAMGVLGGASMKLGNDITSSMFRSINSARQFGKAVADVGTISDMSTEQINDTAMQMSLTFGSDATLQADALYQTISAGVTDAAKATDLLTVANKLAVGGVTDVKTAVDGLTTTINAYDEANLSATDVSDAFFIAIREGKTTAGELSNTIGNVASVAKDAGVSFEELLSSIAATTTKGIDTHRTVSGLAAAMANLAKPTADAKKEASRLGIEFSKNAVRTKGWKGFLDSITQSSNYNKDSLDKLFGSIEGVKVITALTSNESAKLNDVLTKMGARAGETEKAFGKIAMTFDFQVNRLARVGEAFRNVFGETLGELLDPVVTFMVDRLNELLAAYRALPSPVKKVITGGIALAGVMLTMVGGFFLVIGAMNLFGITITGLISGIATLGLVMLPLTVLIGGFAVGAIAAFKAIKSELLSNGKTWEDVADRIKLSYDALLERVRTGNISKEVRKQFEDFGGERLLQFIDDVGNFIDRMKKFWDGFVLGFEMGITQLSPRVRELRDAVLDVFSAFNPAVADESMESLIDGGIRAGEKLAGMGDTVIDAMLSVIEVVEGVKESFGDMTAQDVIDKIVGFKETFDSVIDTLSTIASIAEKIARVIFGALSGLISIGETLGAGFAENVLDVLGKFGLSDVAEQYRIAKLGQLTGQTDLSYMQEDASSWWKKTADIFKGDWFGASTPDEKDRNRTERLNKLAHRTDKLDKSGVNKLQDLTVHLNFQAANIKSAMEREGNEGERTKMMRELEATNRKLATVLERLERNGLSAKVTAEAISNAVDDHKSGQQGRLLEPELM